ncbi:MFS transporter [Mycolicibacterium moriokaense]|uniref:MFS transporter n=1 Tax=Mycolicibacterium moriokaense TaxID=39691 RepID=A0AAD1HIH1_9MYCO|nr:MFS transporter [Mycolicibacterium moriokaense]MCV7041937.1 MFS transporter [Mycolicibacterium moriokaense]ORB12798.1 MFS transporter [Mycolicibacterium moriokaense]BBX04703.1 MFS transporter [Mycolicibacterium moriokaense]
MTRRWSALGVLALGVLLIGVDATVLAVAVPFITKDLGATATQVLWIGDIYSFVLAGLLVTMGGLGDRIGHKKLLLGGAIGFAIMSVATAYAPNAELLIGARALLAVAGATLAPSTLALIRALFSDSRERSVAVGIWAAVFSAGTALGPVVGGLLLEHFWWGSVFLINVPVIAVILVGGAVLLPEMRNPTPGPVDLPSVGLSLVGTLGLVYALKEGVHNGIRIDIVAAGLVGAAAMTLFVRRQLQLPDPLIDIRLFCNRTFTGVVTANLLSILGLSGVVYFLSQYFQLVNGYSPLNAGLAELPAAVAAMVFGVSAGVAVRFWSRRAVLTTGLAVIGFAMASLTTISPATGYPRLGVALFFVGVGLGLAYTVANDLIIGSVPPERTGAAAALSETAYELGMALGIALLGSIIAAVYRGLTIPQGIHDDVASYARETLGAAHNSAATLPPEKAHALLTSAQSAFTEGLAVAAGVGSLLLLASSAAVWFLLKPRSAPEIDHPAAVTVGKVKNMNTCTSAQLECPSGRQEAPK